MGRLIELIFLLHLTIAIVCSQQFIDGGNREHFIVQASEAFDPPYYNLNPNIPYPLNFQRRTGVPAQYASTEKTSNPEVPEVVVVKRNLTAKPPPKFEVEEPERNLRIPPPRQGRKDIEDDEADYADEFSPEDYGKDEDLDKLEELVEQLGKKKGEKQTVKELGKNKGEKQTIKGEFVKELDKKNGEKETDKDIKERFGWPFHLDITKTKHHKDEDDEYIPIKYPPLTYKQPEPIPFHTFDPDLDPEIQKLRIELYKGFRRWKKWKKINKHEYNELAALALIGGITYLEFI